MQVKFRADARSRAPCRVPGRWWRSSVSRPRRLRVGRTCGNRSAGSSAPARSKADDAAASKGAIERSKPNDPRPNGQDALPPMIDDAAAPSCSQGSRAEVIGEQIGRRARPGPRQLIVPVAQWIERRTPRPRRAGSNPAGGSNHRCSPSIAARSDRALARTSARSRKYSRA